MTGYPYPDLLDFTHSEIPGEAQEEHLRLLGERADELEAVDEDPNRSVEDSDDPLFNVIGEYLDFGHRAAALTEEMKPQGQWEVEALGDEYHVQVTCGEETEEHFVEGDDREDVEKFVPGAAEETP